MKTNPQIHSARFLTAGLLAASLAVLAFNGCSRPEQSNAKALSSRMESNLSKLRADYSDAKASASRKAAMEELKKSEADYKTKVSALGDATEATWDSAKQNAIASWDRLQAAYYKARAD